MAEQPKLAQPKFIMMRGPKRCASPLGYCTVCVMIYKGYAMIELEGNGAIEAAPEGEYTYLDLPAPHMDTDGLAEAVAWGIYRAWAMPQFGGNGALPFPVPLCWSHLMPVKVSNSTLAVGSAEEAAALEQMAKQARGPGGAVMLGGG